MKVLLICALDERAKKRFDSNVETLGFTENLECPRLSILYLGAVLEKKGIAVQLTDEVINSETEIKNAILSSEIIGISAMTTDAEQALKWAKFAKEHRKIVIAGGAHATSCPEYFLKSGFVDFIVMGEGEITLPELLNGIYDKKGLRSIDGIGFIENKNMVLTQPRKLIENLDTLPFPAWHLLPMERYFEKQGNVKRMVLVSSRGCPFDCVFCNKHMCVKKYRVRSSANVADEIERLVQKYGVKKIHFVDSLFTGNKQRVTEICQEIVRRNLKIIWNCVARVDTVDYRLLKCMRKAGCSKVDYGVESGSQRILNAMNKGFTLRQVVKSAKAARNAGLMCKFYLIVGFPSETKEDIALTEKILRKTQPNRIVISILSPLPGTAIYNKIKDRINVDCCSDYHLIYGNPIFKHDVFDYVQMRQIREKIYLNYERFYNSQLQKLKRKILRLIWYLTHFYDAIWRIKLFFAR